MSEHYMDLKEGDTLTVHVVPEKPPAKGEPNIFLTIGKVNIFEYDNYAHVSFLSDLDVCNDGSGPKHGDKYYQPETAYYNGGKFLNADKDQYMVVPPQIRSMVPGVVMGCQARVTCMTTNVTEPAVVGDIGPKDKTGEAAYCLAKKLNSKITHNSGDTKLVYLYELWPDVPAKVHGKTYKLEPA